MYIHFVYTGTVQITHNLNKPRVSHACHTHVVFVSHVCSFRGVGGYLATHACGHTCVHAQIVLCMCVPTCTQSVLIHVGAFC